MGSSVCCLDPVKERPQLGLLLRLSTSDKVGKLYDYESSTLGNQQVCLKNSQILSVYKNKIFVGDKAAYLSFSSRHSVDFAFQAQPLQSTFLFSELKGEARGFWNVMQQNQTSCKSVDLQLFTRIKLGKVELVVEALECDTPNEDTPPVARQETACRVCLTNEESSLNPLLSPCRCVGSIKNIHLRCLSLWAKNNTEQEDLQREVVIKVPALVCELCKSRITELQQVNGSPQSLIAFEVVPRPFLLLRIVEEAQKQVFHAVSFAARSSVNIGRSNDKDVLIDQISVSRNHARVTRAGSRFMLSDSGSKFGTLYRRAGEFRQEIGGAVHRIQHEGAAMELEVVEFRRFAHLLGRRMDWSKEEELQLSSKCSEGREEEVCLFARE